jgi:hypothetical protein
MNGVIDQQITTFKCVFLLDRGIIITKETASAASYFDPHLKIDSDGQLRTNTLEK